MSDTAGRLRVYTQEERALIRRIAAKECTDEEFEAFIYRCERSGLDPLARQIYCQIRRYKDGDEWKRSLTIEAHIDGFRVVAERSKCYAPGRDTVFKYEGKALVSATAYVKKRTEDGTWHEFGVEAFFEEYVQTLRDGSTPNRMWKKMPRLMLAKCSEALTLRKGWPQDLSGIYTREEMGQAETDNDERPPQKQETKPAGDKPQPQEKTEAPASVKSVAAQIIERAERVQLLNGGSLEEIIQEHSTVREDGKVVLGTTGAFKGKPICFKDPNAYLASAKDKEKAGRWLQATLARLDDTVKRSEPEDASDAGVDEEAQKFIDETEEGGAFPDGKGAPEGQE